MTRTVNRLVLILASAICLANCTVAQNRDPLKTQIVTSDLDNFWKAFEKAKPNYDPAIFQELYINPGSKGVEGFMEGRIVSAKNLAKEVATHPKYFETLKQSTDQIAGMKQQIVASLVKLKDYYPNAIFPPVYFVIGGLSSGGTSSDDGLIIGAEMYGLTPTVPKEELDDWLQTVIKPVAEVPHIVAHELIHFQQSYDGGTLLNACLKEGSADFIAELISGKHINQHVHDFANPHERELWEEFKTRMLKDDYSGWLYSSSPGRPNDLGYWMGYQISKAYFDKSTDKKVAVAAILNIKDEEKFLEESGYAEKFK